MLPLRLLLIEDNPDDADLLVATLKRGGLEFDTTVVDSVAGVEQALEQQVDFVISDYSLPGFSGPMALEMVRAKLNDDVPFIIVSGAVGEEVAADVLRSGANDYVMKNNFARLIPAVRRELAEAEVRREHRRVADLLSETQQRLHATFEQAPLGIAIADLRGVLIDVNERFARMLGYERQDLIGRNTLEITHPDDRKVTMAGLGTESDDVLRFEKRYIGRDGQPLWVRVTVSVIRRGADTYKVGMVEDISGVKQAEARLHLQDHLLDSVEQAVIATDASGTITYMNRFASRLHGCERSEAIGKPIFEVVPAEEALPSSHELHARLASGESWAGTFPMRRQDGTTFPAWLTLSPLADRDGRFIGTVGVSHDISERIATESELRRRSAQQEALAELSQRAQRGEEIGELYDYATTMVARLLDADFAEVIQPIADGRHVLVAASGWPESRLGIVMHSEKFNCLDLALESQQPLIISDLASDDRFSALQVFVDMGINSGAIVPISGAEGAKWGLLVAHARARIELRTDDLNFLRAVANVLGQVLDTRRAADELRTRNAQQIATAEFVRHSFSRSAAEVISDACAILREMLGVEFAIFIDLDAQSGELNAGAGAPAAYHSGPIPADRTSLTGRALISAGPVVIPDYDRDPHLATVKIFSEFALKSGAAMKVEGKRRTFGVLTAHSTRPARFANSDTQFLSAVANALAESLERLETQQALVESEERYRSVVEGASEVVYTLTPEGAITSLNAAFGRVTGWSTEECLNLKFEELIVPEERAKAMAAFLRVLKGEPIIDLDLTLLTKSGGTALIETSASPRFENNQLVAIHGFSRDVTQKRKLEAQLAQANRINGLGRLAATIAHEFNNVLMGILPFTEVLRRNPAPERHDAALEHITTAVRRGKRITEEILRFANPAQPVMTATSVGTWLGRVVAEMKSVVGPSYNIDCIVPEADLAMVADANQLHQVMSNLILNARDAMPAGGQLEIAVSVEKPSAEFAFGLIEHPEKFLHVRLTDHGCGIPAEVMQHIFEPLFTTKRSGTGLGLAVTHQVLQTHGGQIFVESIEGEGTTFHLFIPLAEAAAAALLEPPPWGNTLPVRRILLVEDDPNVSAGLSALLELEGIEVDLVTTGAEVMPALLKRRPDAMVLDIGLPDMDGTKVYAGVAGLYPTLPVVFSTGHGDERSLEQFLSSDNVAMLLKPYDVATLLKTLSHVAVNGRGESAP